MAKAESLQNGNGIKTECTDDVEKSLELLDKVLSEFEEEPEILRQIEPDSPSQGHQSEDDGYMSMNGRRAKFVPDFQPTDEAQVVASPSLSPPLSTQTATNKTGVLVNAHINATVTEIEIEQNQNSPPSPEEAERIISNLLPRLSSPEKTANSRNSDNNKHNSHHNNIENGLSDMKIKNLINSTDVCDSFDGKITSVTTKSPTQTTLPKTRPNQPTRYASLPCSSPPKVMGPIENGNGGSLDGGRNKLGIGISAVHDAVLRGMARMPEPILNEHPVTIYPGRSSPSRRIPPRTLPGGIERHRDVCRGEFDSEENSSSSPDNNESEYNSSLSPTHGIQININFNNNLIKNRSFTNIDVMNLNKKRTDSDEERFSEDSLEESSLPPPPAPITVPPPPSLSAPVTPSKRHSIAWEVNLDDPASFGDPLAKSVTKPGSTKVIGRRKIGKSVNGSQSSLESKKSESVEWPEPPDIPICSTEDEAASLYSDSDDLLQNAHDINGRGTYVIRKGRKQRQCLINLDSNSSINSRLSNEAIVNLPSPVFPMSMSTPKSRHSIDLGATAQQSIHAQTSSQNHHPSVHSPRSRLSLDLSSPTSELSTNLLAASSSKQNATAKSLENTTSIYNNNNNNNINVNNNSNSALNNFNTSCTSLSSNSNNNITSSNSNINNNVVHPRYTEFKTYSSTFDGLQALENSNNNLNRGGTCTNSNDNLMRVSSLPAINPALVTPGEVIISTTPRRELAPPIEEDEEVDSDTTQRAPLRQIENNISALLRGDLQVARVAVDIPPTRRPGFRLGVHKSESAKEMKLNHAGLGPLPPSPPSTSPEPESDEFPPLPPSPAIYSFSVNSQPISVLDRSHPPAIPPHRGPSINTLKTRSMDAGFSKSYRNGTYAPISPHAPGTLPPDLPGCNSRRRILTGGYQKRTAQSPREERSLQTSCSLPETPIFTRGCDIPRTPHRRAPEVPLGSTGSRTAPRANTNSLGSSVVGISPSTIGGRQRSISQALANGEMLRMAGGPARGWYPKQRHARPASTENLDRLNLNPQGSLRAWEASTGSRKPLTLPPNLTPKFFNKSPREALRRVTSLLIRKGNSSGKEKESKRDKDKDKHHKEHVFSSVFVQRSPVDVDSRTYHHHHHQQAHSSSTGPPTIAAQPPTTTTKKKGFFRSFWKKSRHYSLEKQ